MFLTADTQRTFGTFVSATRRKDAPVIDTRIQIVIHLFCYWSTTFQLFDQELQLQKFTYAHCYGGGQHKRCDGDKERTLKIETRHVKHKLQVENPFRSYSEGSQAD